jgi:hypothetical protein
MSETPTAPEQQGFAGSTGPTTPESQAIVAFVLAVLTLLGQTSWTAAVQALSYGANFPQSRFSDVMLWWAVSNGIVSVAAALLGGRVVTRSVGGWPHHLARAAVGLAALGLLLAVITAVGALLH